MKRSAAIAIAGLASLVSLLVASAASAFTFELTTPDGDTPLVPGTLVSVDLWLDADATGIVDFSVAVLFDHFSLEYVPEESSLTSYLLYAPPVGKSIPATWLTPLFDPPGLSPGTPYQMNVDFYSAITDSRATQDDAHVGELVFRVRDGASESAVVAVSLEPVTSYFRVVQAEVTDIKASVETGPPITIPEPSAALMHGTSLAVLSLLARRVARRRARRAGLDALDEG